MQKPSNFGRTKTMKVELMAGRDIDIYKFPTDSTAILLNDTAIKRMGLENPLGAEVVINGGGRQYAQRWPSQLTRCGMKKTSQHSPGC